MRICLKHERTIVSAKGKRSLSGALCEVFVTELVSSIGRLDLMHLLPFIIMRLADRFGIGGIYSLIVSSPETCIHKSLYEPPLHKRQKINSEGNTT